jgi:hypothetical protein
MTLDVLSPGSVKRAVHVIIAAQVHRARACIRNGTVGCYGLDTVNHRRCCLRAIYPAGQRRDRNTAAQFLSRRTKKMSDPR